MKEKSMQSYANKREKGLKPKARTLDQAIAPAPMPAKDPYQSKYDFETLMRAEEVKGDKSRHRSAKKHGKEQLKSIARVMGKKKNAGKMGVKEA